MYAPEIVQRKLDAVQKKLSFDLQRHSYSEIQSRIAALNDLVPRDTLSWKDRNSRIIPTRPLDQDEMKFVINEQILSTCDFRYWCSNYAKIVFDERLIPLKLNVAQNIVVDVWGEMELAGREIAEMALKARQLGKSTVTEAAIAHRVQFHPRVNAIVASSNPDQSEKMAKMMERIWENEPWFMLPYRTGYRSGDLIDFGYMRSVVSIQHGRQFTGISRGDSPTSAHLSEVSEFVNPEDLIDASLLRCMHPSPNIFIVLESTASGLNNYWHRTWDDAKEGYAIGMSRLRPCFLPWFVGSDIYPTPTWLKARPIPEGWIPATITVKHADRAAAYVKASDLLTKYLGANWRMPREQMWYWEVERASAVRKKILSKFLQEMPADDQEAFQSTNISCFEVDVIAEHRDNAKQPAGVYGIVGSESEIPVRLQPGARDILTVDQQNDKGNRPLIVKAHWHPEDIEHTYKFLPLKYQGVSNCDPMGKVFIYEHPMNDHEYGIGVDTSDGIGKDRSVIEVVRKGDLFRNDAQVAEYANAYVNSYDLWPIVFALATYYSVLQGGRRKQSKVVIEIRGNGETTQLEIKKRGWHHFHQWVRYDKKRIRQSEARNIGWYTNEWSRPMMMDLLIKALRDMWLEINSPWFISEMQSLSRDDSHQSIRAEYGGWDDRIMALGMPFFSLHALERYGRSPSLNEQRVEYERAMAEHPRYDSGGMGIPSFVPDFRPQAPEASESAARKIIQMKKELELAKVMKQIEEMEDSPLISA